MTFLDLALLAVALVGGALVVDHLRVREAALRVARQACAREKLQLLDDTVQGVRVRFARDAHGRATLARTFAFDFSDDGLRRRAGSIVMIGSQLASLDLEPYRLRS